MPGQRLDSRRQAKLEDPILGRSKRELEARVGVVVVGIGRRVGV